MCGRTEGKSSKNYSIFKGEYYKELGKRMKELWTDEMRQRASKKGKELANNPEYIKKVSEGVRKAYDTTNLREKISKSSKERFQDEHYKKKWRESIDKNTKEYWTDVRKEDRSNLIKQQNKENPELAKKRLDAISNHMYNKTDEWKQKASIIQKEVWNKEENKQKRRDLYKNSNFNNSRVVINKHTGEKYKSIKDASRKLNMNYSTLKKYFYKNDKKCPIKLKED